MCKGLEVDGEHESQTSMAGAQDKGQVILDEAEEVGRGQTRQRCRPW